jgi:hypothetical protein
VIQHCHQIAQIGRFGGAVDEWKEEGRLLMRVTTNISLMSLSRLAASGSNIVFVPPDEDDDDGDTTVGGVGVDMTLLLLHFCNDSVLTTCSIKIISIPTLTHTHHSLSSI